MASTASELRRYVQRNIPTAINTLTSHPRIESADDPLDDDNILWNASRTLRKRSVSETGSSSSVETFSTDLSESLRTTSMWSGAENYTRRSSDFFLHEDEFDRLESQKVKKLLESIEWMLFDNSEDGPAEMLVECKEWTSAFPHLRIVGKTIVPSQSPGYQFYSGSDIIASEPSSPLSFMEFSSHDLTVQGLPITIWEPPSSDGKLFPDEPCLIIEEDDGELIALDGILEEYFAIDHSFENLSISENRQRWKSCVPISPSECFRNDILQVVFSKIWIEVAESFDALIRHFWETAQHYARSGRRLTLVPTLVHWKSGDFHWQSGDSTITTQRSMFDVSTHKSAQQFSATSTGAAQVDVVRLDGLLQISTKALQARDKTFTHLDTDFTSTVKRPVSNTTSVLGQMTQKVGEHVPSPRNRAVGRAKLAPILGNDHSKASFWDEEQSPKPALPNGFIRGIKMTTIADWPMAAVGPKTATNSPGGPLPPIGREVANEILNNWNHVSNNRRNLAHGNMHRLKTAGDEREKAQRGLRPKTSFVHSSVEPTSRRSTTRNSVSLSVSADSGANRLTVTGSNAGYAHLTQASPETYREFEQNDQSLDSVGRRHSTNSMSYRQSNIGSHNFRNMEGDMRRSSTSRTNAVAR